ncbi:phage tail protein [Lysinibacillus fusiformis]|uniref:phage tail protein n=1 Tax=Lysinibacillus fusiformis TaxID=28031 RepID=UPI00301AF26A
MSENFYTILTNAGLAAIANAVINQTQVNFAKLGVGDGNGAYYAPTQEATALRNQVWIGNISSVTADTTNPNWVNVETVIPGSVGGFEIRELGIFDDNNVLLAIGKLPLTYKPNFAEGSSKDLYIKAIFEVTNASAVTLKVDPSVIYASKKYVDDKIDSHAKERASTTKLGHTILSNSTTSYDETTAATSKAVKDVMDVVNVKKDDITSHVFYATTVGGTANNIAVTINADIKSYQSGLCITFYNTMGANVNGNVTIDVNGLGNRHVVKDNGSSSYTPGEFPTNQFVTVRILPNKGNFRLVSKGGGAVTPEVKEYTTPGTFSVIPPSGASRVLILVWGAGGGGGGCGARFPGGGGGGGAFIMRYVDIKPGDKLEIRVGLGGNGGAGRNQQIGQFGVNGGIGGFSSVNVLTGTTQRTQVIAYGGGGGEGGGDSVALGRGGSGGTIYSSGLTGTVSQSGTNGILHLPQNASLYGLQAFSGGDGSVNTNSGIGGGGGGAPSDYVPGQGSSYSTGGNEPAHYINFRGSRGGNAGNPNGTPTAATKGGYPGGGGGGAASSYTVGDGASGGDGKVILIW